MIGPGSLAALSQEEPDVRLLDVRTPGEFESADMRGACNVPLGVAGSIVATAVRALTSGISPDKPALGAS